MYKRQGKGTLRLFDVSQPDAPQEIVKIPIEMTLDTKDFWRLTMHFDEVDGLTATSKLEPVFETEKE